MMEAAPSAPFEMPKPELLLEVLIVALDAPTQFGSIDQPAEGDVLWKGREPVFGRFILALGPLDQQPLFLWAFGKRVTMGNANTHARKPRGQPLGRAFPPLDRTPSFRAQAKRDLLDRDHLRLATAPALRCLSVAPGRPYQRVRLDAGHVDQLQRRQARAQPRVVAIGGIRQHDAARKAGLTRPADVLERNLQLGREADLLGYPCLAPTLAILSPLLRQIQAISHRQACVVIGKRQRHRDLAVVLLADLATVLPRHPHRVAPLLGK